MSTVHVLVLAIQLQISFKGIIVNCFVHVCPFHFVPSKASGVTPKMGNKTFSVKEILIFYPFALGF